VLLLRSEARAEKRVKTTMPNKEINPASCKVVVLFFAFMSGMTAVSTAVLPALIHV
jgi:hypothetical protein